MLYVLILTVFLGIPGDTAVISTEILFKTEKECQEALKVSSFETDLPFVGATAECQRRRET